MASQVVNTNPILMVGIEHIYKPFVNTLEGLKMFWQIVKWVQSSVKLDRGGQERIRRSTICCLKFSP